MEGQMRILFADPAEPDFVTFSVVPSNAPRSDIAGFLRRNCGVGNPFYAFNEGSVPTAVQLNPAYDWGGAGTVSESDGVTEAILNSQLADIALQACPNHWVWQAGTTQPAL